MLQMNEQLPAEEIRRLQQQESNLRTAQRLLHLGTWKLDLDTSELHWSDSVYRMYGVDRDAFASTYDAYVAVVHPDDRAAMEANFATYVAHPTDYFEFRHRILRPDDSVIHVHGIGELVTDNGNRMLTGIVQDVSADVAASNRLAAATSLLRIAGKSARIGGWRVNLRTGMVEWSDEINHIHELSERHTLTLDEALNYYAPEHRDHIRQLFTACSEQGTGFDTVLQLITARGNRRWVRTIGEAARDADGNITWVRGAFQDVTELIRARESTEELSRRLHQTLDSMSDAFILIDKDFCMAYVNKQAGQLLQRDPAVLFGRKVWDEFPEAVAAGFREPYERALVTGESSHFTRYYPPLSAWYKVDAYPSPEGLGVYFRDVSAEREREAQLRLLETAVARQNDILVITEASPLDSPDGPRIIYVNDAFTRITGFSREEAIGKTPRILQGPNTNPAELARIRAALEAGKPVRAELINYTRDGDEYWLELDISVLRDAQNQPTHFVAVQRDTTARKQTEMALHERVKELNCLYQVSSFKSDAHSSITAILRKIVNILPSAMLHADIAVSRIHYQDEEIRSAPWREPVVSTEVQIAQGDQIKGLLEVGYFQKRSAPDSGDNFLPEELNMLEVIGNHISQMLTNRETTRQLMQSEKLGAIGQLTGGVAHDFNNLLTVILGNMELLKERLANQAELQPLADTTMAATERGVELTKRLLAFARRQALEPQSLDVNRLLESTETLLRRALSENIDIEIIKTDGLWITEADPGQLESALLNLAINARDAMPDGGRLTIETANTMLDENYADRHQEVVSGEYVMISVSDTGSGMAREAVEQAFEPFYTTKAIGKGSGLGLSMVYGFVKQSGGHTKIYSEPDEGTTIRLYFPRTRSNGESMHEKPLQTEERGGSEHILVVEDDDMVRNVAIALLKRLGYRVTSATSGPAAMEILHERNDIDLLFTDIIMPGGMNGRELADAARELQPELKVLYTSGYTENAIVHHGRLDRGVQLLSKPYRRQDLATKVRNVLDS